jgi:hypothetical protein
MIHKQDSEFSSAKYRSYPNDKSRQVGRELGSAFIKHFLNLEESVMSPGSRW